MKRNQMDDDELVTARVMLNILTVVLVVVIVVGLRWINTNCGG